MGEYYIMHSAGPWKKHKYIKKIGDRYIYATDQIGKVASKAGKSAMKNGTELANRAKPVIKRTAREGIRTAKEIGREGYRRGRLTAKKAYRQANKIRKDPYNELGGKYKKASNIYKERANEQNRRARSAEQAQRWYERKSGKKEVESNRARNRALKSSPREAQRLHRISRQDAMKSQEYGAKAEQLSRERKRRSHNAAAYQYKSDELRNKYDRSLAKKYDQAKSLVKRARKEGAAAYKTGRKNAARMYKKGRSTAKDMYMTGKKKARSEAMQLSKRGKRRLKTAGSSLYDAAGGNYKKASKRSANAARRANKIADAYNKRADSEDRIAKTFDRRTRSRKAHNTVRNAYRGAAKQKRQEASSASHVSKLYKQQYDKSLAKKYDDTKRSVKKKLKGRRK